MRQIKFRAYDEGNKKMHTDVEFIKSGDDGDDGNDWICISSNEQQYKVEGHRLVFDDPYCRRQIHLMQFTGLKDKSGKEIYEGDVLQYSTSRNGSVYGAVIWEQQACAFWFKWNDGNIHRYKELKATFGDGEIYRYDSVEVIGNIYEHPELLNPQ